jgi:hypothetical protein
LGKFPQLFCLQSRHVGHTNFGTWRLANSIRAIFESAYNCSFTKAISVWRTKFLRCTGKAWRRMFCPHPRSSTTSDVAMQGSKVMRQRGAETLVPEEPYELVAHVRDCGGAGWATTGSTRKLTAHSAGFVVVPGLGGCGPQLSGSVRHTR